VAAPRAQQPGRQPKQSVSQQARGRIGRTGVHALEKPIVDGSGTVRIDDTVWRVAGPDAPAGSRVRIVQADGASLTVTAA
jgi:membrane protein implicated in regulation of membrane protease activity